jgi:hypothetical protein
MPIPMEDLPDELRGTAVPADDLDIGRGEPRRGASPQRVRAARAPMDAMDAVEGFRGASESVIDMGRGAIAEGAGLLAQTGAFLRNRIPFVPQVNSREVRENATNSVRDMIPFEPSEAGQHAAERLASIGEAVAPVMEAWRSAPQEAYDVPVVGPVWGPIVEGAQLGTEWMAALGGMRRPAPVPNETTAAAAARGPDARTAHPGHLAAALDLQVSPSDLQHALPELDVSGMAKGGESVARGVQAEQRALANAPKINQIAGREIGVPDNTVLTPEVFEGAKEPHYRPYEALRQTAEIPATAGYLQSLRGIGGGRDILPDAVAEFSPIREKYLNPGTSSEMVDSIKLLRNRSSKRFQAKGQNEHIQEAVAKLERELADTLEDELGRRATAAGNPAAQAQLRSARRELAKIYTVEDATVADHVDPQLILKAKKRGAMLSGNLATIAELAERLPNSLQHPQSVNPAGLGLENSAAGPMGVMARGAQNVTRRLGADWAVNSFNRGLKNELGGATIEQLRPDNFRPRYDQDPLMGPNDGPAQPPRDPFMTLAPEPGMNPSGAAPGAVPWGAPPPGGMARSFADQLAGDLQLEGAPTPFAPTNTPFQRPLDTVNLDTERFAGARQALEMRQGGGGPFAGNFGEAGPRFAQADELALLEQPGAAFDEFQADALPWEVPGNLPPMQGPRSSFADQLGPTGRDPLVPQEPLEIQPQNLSQVSAPRVPEGLELDPQQVNPDYVPADSFAQLIADLEQGQGAPPMQRAQDFGFGDDLELADDAGPARSRMDVTESLPSQGTERFPDRYKRPEAVRVETDDGYIAYVEDGNTWKIDDAFVKETARGKGEGQQQLLKLANRADAKGKTLNSDAKVSTDQRRVYDKLKGKGVITFDGPFDDGGPVFRNIRPTE